VVRKRPAPAQFFEVLRSLLAARRSMIERRVRIGFVLFEGARFVVDLGDPAFVSERWRDDLDAAVLTTAGTLADWLDGTFDAKAPRPGQIFVCSGDRSAFAAIERVLCEGRSALAIRASLKAKCSAA
jgi:hypothetical protein